MTPLSTASVGFLDQGKLPALCMASEGLLRIEPKSGGMHPRMKKRLRLRREDQEILELIMVDI
jgi:hypothetical protein